MGSDTVYCSRKGGRQRGNGWSKSIFLENKVAINFDLFITFLFSGHLDYPFQSYGPKQVRLISTRPINFRILKTLSTIGRFRRIYMGFWPHVIYILKLLSFRAEGLRQLHLKEY